MRASGGSPRDGCVVDMVWNGHGVILEYLVLIHARLLTYDLMKARKWWYTTAPAYLGVDPREDRVHGWGVGSVHDLSKGNNMRQNQWPAVTVGVRRWCCPPLR